MATSSKVASAVGSSLDAVIVGAGFSGLYMLHRLRGRGLTARIFEAGSGVGGTWFWNRYPGARCDVESLEYSYSFSDELEREWRWSERYASQPEILRYLNHVAERFDLLRDIEFETRVLAAHFDEAASRWTIDTSRGECISAQFCIMATGCLSAAKIPDFPGRDTFRGKTYHTGHWPHEGVDFTGQRVAVIGTGSSAIQSIPNIARQASQVYVFQRTPNFSVPAQNGPLTDEVQSDWQAHRHEYRERARVAPFGLLIEQSETPALDVPADAREGKYEACWRRGGFALLGSYADIITSQGANDTAAEFVRGKIRDVVRNPDVAEKLLPRDYPIATKRLCVDTGYYATFNRDNVTLIDARATPIREITPSGVRTADGAEYTVDSIVFATGFDAMTGALNNIDIRGRSGVALKQKWAAGPRTYLGLTIAGFPNLFTVTGPGSPSVLANMIMAIEQHVEWIADCLGYLRARGIASIEATPEAEDAWVAHVNEVANTTLFPRANSWYVGANIPGKPRVFMPYIGGLGVYREKCAGIAANGYEGFALNALASAAP